MNEQFKRMGSSARSLIKQASELVTAKPDVSEKAVTFGTAAKIKTPFQNFSLENHVYREYITTMAIAFLACVWAVLHLLAGENENPNPNAIFFGIFLPVTGACAYVFRTVAKEWFRHREGGSADVFQFCADLSSSMALLLGPMATCLRLLDSNAQATCMAAAALFFLALGAFVPLGNLLVRRSYRARQDATLGVFALAALVAMTWMAATSLAATDAEARALSARWLGGSALWKMAGVVAAGSAAAQLRGWTARSAAKHALRVQAAVAAAVTAACAERSVWLLAPEDGWAVRAGLGVVCAGLCVLLLAGDLLEWWQAAYPAAARRVQHGAEDAMNALTMRTSAAVEEEKARSHVRESKLASRVLELLSVISRKDEVLLSQARTLQTMETSLLNAQVQQQITSEQNEELKELLGEARDVCEEGGGYDKVGQVLGAAEPWQLRRRPSKKEREQKEQERQQREVERRGSQAEVRSHKRTLPQGPPTPQAARHRQHGDDDHDDDHDDHGGGGADGGDEPGQQQQPHSAPGGKLLLGGRGRGKPEEERAPVCSESEACGSKAATPCGSKAARAPSQAQAASGSGSGRGSRRSSLPVNASPEAPEEAWAGATVPADSDDAELEVEGASQIAEQRATRSVAELGALEEMLLDVCGSAEVRPPSAKARAPPESLPVSRADCASLNEGGLERGAAGGEGGVGGPGDSGAQLETARTTGSNHDGKQAAGEDGGALSAAQGPVGAVTVARGGLVSVEEAAAASASANLNLKAGSLAGSAFKTLAVARASQGPGPGATAGPGNLNLPVTVKFTVASASASARSRTPSPEHSHQPAGYRHAVAAAGAGGPVKQLEARATDSAAAGPGQGSGTGPSSRAGSGTGSLSDPGPGGGEGGRGFRERSLSLASTLLELSVPGQPNVNLNRKRDSGSGLNASPSATGSGGGLGGDGPGKSGEAQAGKTGAEAGAGGGGREGDPRHRKFSERFGGQRGGLGGGGEGEFGAGMEASHSTAGGQSAAWTHSQRTFNGSSSMLGVIQVKIPLSEQEENLLRLEVEEKEEEAASLRARVLALERLLADATGNRPLPLLPRAGALAGVGQSFRWFRGQGAEEMRADMVHRTFQSYKIRRSGEEPTEKKDKPDKGKPDKGKDKTDTDKTDQDKDKDKDKDKGKGAEGTAASTKANKDAAGQGEAAETRTAEGDAGAGGISTAPVALTGEKGDSEGGDVFAAPALGAEAGCAEPRPGRGGLRLAFAAPHVQAEKPGGGAGERAEGSGGDEGGGRGEGGEGAGEVRYGRNGGESGAGRIDDFYLMAQLIGMEEAAAEAASGESGADKPRPEKTLYFY